MAQIDREVDQAGYDVPGAGQHVPPAVGDDRWAACFFDDFSHFSGDLGGGLERVTAQVHRRGAGVVGPPLDRHPESIQAGDGIDDPQR